MEAFRTLRGKFFIVRVKAIWKLLKQLQKLLILNNSSSKPSKNSSKLKILMGKNIKTHLSIRSKLVTYIEASNQWIITRKLQNQRSIIYELNL